MDTRTASQIRHHYDVERELADRLRNASKTWRLKLYSQVYDELFRRVPNIPHLGRLGDAGYRNKEVDGQLRFLDKFLRPQQTFLEVGPGDCRLSLKVASRVTHVYAVDVTQEIVKDLVFPDNVTFRISDGCNVPVPEATVDLAYSDQLIEHLHPEDAFDHLQSVRKALAPAGIHLGLAVSAHSNSAATAKIDQVTVTP